MRKSWNLFLAACLLLLLASIFINVAKFGPNPVVIYAMPFSPFLTQQNPEFSSNPEGDYSEQLLNGRAYPYLSMCVVNRDLEVFPGINAFEHQVMYVISQGSINVYSGDTNTLQQKLPQPNIVIHCGGNYGNQMDWPDGMYGKTLMEVAIKHQQTLGISPTITYHNLSNPHGIRLTPSQVVSLTDTGCDIISSLKEMGEINNIPTDSLFALVNRRGHVLFLNADNSPKPANEVLHGYDFDNAVVTQCDADVNQRLKKGLTVPQSYELVGAQLKELQ